MTFEVRLSRSAAKAFGRLDDSDRERIRRALQRLARDASGRRRVGGKSAKTIRGTHDMFHRLRVGDFRVLYDVIPEERVILVLGIVDRAELQRWLRGR